MEVTYGTGIVKAYLRTDGRWVLRWKEVGKWRSTTFKGSETEMKKKARKLAKDVDRVSGGKVVSVAETEILDRLKAISGEGSLHRFLDKVENIISVSPASWGLDQVADFIQQHSERIESNVGISILDAYWKLVDYYDKINASPQTLLNPRKEVKAYGEKYPEIEVQNLTREELVTWISRGNPAPQYFNNRLATWKAFLTKCQEWGHLDEERMHVLAGVKKRKVPQKSPEILSVKQMKAGLKILEEESVGVQAAFMIGCWAGLRPFEIKRLSWNNIDFKSKYIHVTVDVSRKLVRERFVLMPKCLLKGLRAIKARGRVCKTHEWKQIANALKEAEVIKKWPQDLLRHSFCSYRLAQCGDAAKVADEAGNSPDVVRSVYRKPLKKKDGEAWFSALC